MHVYMSSMEAVQDVDPPLLCSGGIQYHFTYFVAFGLSPPAPLVCYRFQQPKKTSLQVMKSICCYYSKGIGRSVKFVFGASEWYRPQKKDNIVLELLQADCYISVWQTFLCHSIFLNNLHAIEFSELHVHQNPILICCFGLSAVFINAHLWNYNKSNCHSDLKLKNMGAIFLFPFCNCFFNLFLLAILLSQTAKKVEKEG